MSKKPPKKLTINVPKVKVLSKTTTPLNEGEKVHETLRIGDILEQTIQDPPKEKKKKIPDGQQPMGTGRGGVPPPEHSRWKPGESGNPGGRPKNPEGLKELKHLTKAELVRAGNMIISMTPEELKEYAEDDDTTSLHVMLSSIVSRIIRTGDMAMFDRLLDRLIGKVKEEVRGDFNLNVNGSEGEVRVAGVRKIFALPSNGRERRSQPA